MDVIAYEEVVQEAGNRRLRYAFGLLGLVVAAIGLALGVMRPHIIEAIKPPPPPEKMADVLAEAGDKFVGKMVDRVRGKKAEPPPKQVPWPLYSLSPPPHSVWRVHCPAQSVGFDARIFASR